MKSWSVTYTFQELPGHLIYHHAQVKATGIGMACHKAYQEIKARPAIKGRRLHQAKVMVVETGNSRVTDE